MSEANHGQVASMLEGYVNQMKITPEAAGLGNTYVAQKAAMEEAGEGHSAFRPIEKLHPLLEKMAAECEKRGASDIFISAGFPPSFKINGELTPVPLKPLTQQDTQVLVYSTMSSEQRSRFDHELELNYSATSKDGIRFRVNAYHEQGRMGMVWRRITTNILTVDDLKLPQGLKELAMKPRGLLILAGATGSGKSTSMAAMLDWRNKHAAGHIVTIEDPVEYIHTPIKSIFTRLNRFSRSANWAWTRLLGRWRCSLPCARRRMWSVWVRCVTNTPWNMRCSWRKRVTCACSPSTRTMRCRPSNVS